MAAKFTVVVTVEKVERVDGFLRRYLNVTAKRDSHSLTFQVGEHKASSYPIGKEIVIKCTTR